MNMNIKLIFLSCLVAIHAMPEQQDFAVVDQKIEDVHESTELFEVYDYIDDTFDSNLSIRSIIDLFEQAFATQLSKDETITKEQVENFIDSITQVWNSEGFKKKLNENVFSKSESINHRQFVDTLTVFNAETKENALLMTFKMFDLDGDGKITADELQQLLNSEDLQWTLENCQKMIDKDNPNGTIDLSAFTRMVKDNDFRQSEDCLENFRQVDQNEDNKITNDELASYLNGQYGECLPELISNYFYFLDTNVDKVIDSEEFCVQTLNEM